MRLKNEVILVRTMPSVTTLLCYFHVLFLLLHVDAGTLTFPAEVTCYNDQVTLQIKQKSLNVDGQVTFNTRLYHVNGNGTFPAVTIRMKAGTQCKIVIQNDLDLGSTQGTCPFHSNTFHCADSTVLHTHGLHVSPTQDNIDTNVQPQQNLTYTYDIPSNHLMGTHWYHAHKHGSTALQVMGGLLGALLVDPADSYTLPTSLDNLYNQGRTKVLVLAHIHMSASDTNGGGFSMDSYPDIVSAYGAQQTVTLSNTATPNIYVVNGLYNPTTTVLANDATVFRFIHGGGTRSLELQMDAATCTMVLLARDGIFHQSSYLTIQQITFVPGTRADVAIKCTTAGVTAHLFSPANPSSCIGGNTHGAQDPVLTMSVVAAGGSTVYDFPTEFATLPSYLSDLRNATNAESPKRPTDGSPMTNVNLGPGTGPGSHGVNGVSFRGFEEADETLKYVAVLAQDHVYEVQMGNTPPNANAPRHPYHHHINHFQMQSNDSCAGTVYRSGEWRDVVGQEGQLVRWPTPDFSGEVVMHCHFLEHEDLGMMALWRICSVSETTGVCAYVSTLPPTKAPTGTPTKAPTNAPSKAPTNSPTDAPSTTPTSAPSPAPTPPQPSISPTDAPTDAPSQSPTSAPTPAPTPPTPMPTPAPTVAASAAGGGVFDDPGATAGIAIGGVVLVVAVIAVAVYWNRNKNNSTKTKKKEEKQQVQMQPQHRAGNQHRRSQLQRQISASGIVPPGWEQHVDNENGGVPYYYNTKTGETRWERPNAV